MLEEREGSSPSGRTNNYLKMDYKKDLKIIKEFVKKLKKNSEIGKKLLINAGIWDENCNLTKPYKNPDINKK